MSAAFFVGSDRAGAICGGSAPIAFRRSTGARRSLALPSTSTYAGEPSRTAPTMNFAASAGCFDSIGVTLMELALVIRESFLNVLSTDYVDSSLLTF